MKKKTVTGKTVKKTGAADNLKLKQAITILDAHGAVDIKAFSTVKESGLWDHYIVCSGASSVHTGALRDHLKKEMAAAGFPIFYEDRDTETKWIAADFGDILVHIFEPETRMYYALERMWSGSEENLDFLTV
jgi:ribosome-associated protein